MAEREPSPLEAALQGVELALRAGAEACDVLVERYDESAVTVRKGEVEKLIEAGGRSLGLRVINSGRTAVCSTSDFSLGSLTSLAQEAVELALLAAPDPCAGLPSPADLARPTRTDGLQLYDESLRAMTIEDRIVQAQLCESAALAEDRRITNTDGATFSSRIGETALANSLGFAASYPATNVGLSVEVMADDADGKKRNAHWFSSERSLHRLASPAEIGRIAAQRAVAQLGARKTPTVAVPVVFEPLMTVSLLRLLAGCASGSALYRGSTFLAGREGQRIGSQLVSITDDARLPGRGGSRPFDSEGVATGSIELFRGGLFHEFLFDVYTARRAGRTTTGSAHRSVESLPAPGSSNLVWAAGDTPAAKLVGEVQEGFYVTNLMGFGFNPTTGDFSRGAGGFWILGGELAFPVTEVNISGQMESMLDAVDAVGDDLTWFGGAAAPSIRIAEMMVAGI